MVFVRYLCDFPGRKNIRFVAVLFRIWCLCYCLLTWSKLHLADDIFTLKSSKGPCAFEHDSLTCGPHVTKASEFTVCISQIVLRDIASCSHTAYRPRMVSSLTVIALPSMPTIHPRGVHRVMCMLRKGGGLLRSRSPGLQSRWAIFTVAFLSYIPSGSWVIRWAYRDVIELHRNPGIE